MSAQDKSLDKQSPVKQKEKVTSGNLEQSLAVLAKYGSLDLFKSTIRTIATRGKQRAGVENLARPARKEIFYTDPHWSDSRKELKSRLKMWKEFVSDSKEIDQLLSDSVKRFESVSEVLTKNLQTASKSVRNLETSYRAVASFFTNAEKTKGAKVDNIDIMNASLEQLKDLDNPIFLNRIADQFEKYYNKLDLMNTYSLLVVPGWLGSALNIDTIAEIAARNKVMFVTDFADVDSVEDAVQMLKSFNLQSADRYKAYTCVTCNYVVGRAGTEGIDEEIYIPGSCALAGRMAANPLQIPQAGYTEGRLKEIPGVKFPMKQTELGDLNELGVIPMTYEFERAIAFGTSTLFNGDEPGLKNYCVIRTHDFIIKTIKDLFNRYTFNLIDFDLRGKIRSKLNNFFQKNTGDTKDKLISHYDIKSIDVFDNDKLRVNIDVKYKFPAKVLEINLQGLQGEGGGKVWADDDKK